VRRKRLHPYPAAVLATARRRKLLGPADHVLAAVSAGPDSTALVAALASLRDAGEIAELRALHVDHRLRPGGEEDAACARSACERLAVPFESVPVAVAPGNVQASARRARYAALRAAAARHGATRIATGHTRTDQAETVLLHLLRGAGARGIAGIPPRRGAVVRPLIDRSREEGIAWIRALGLPWRDDPTNATPRYARNRLRQVAWPALLRLAPSAERALARAADLARADERALSRRARELLAAPAGVELAALRREPLAVRRRAVRALALRASRAAARALGADHVDAVLALARRRAPGRLSLPRGLEARCRYGRLDLVLAPAEGEAGAPPEPVPVPGPGRYAVPALGVAVEVEAGEAGAPWPLVLRTRRAGDRFAPEGGSGTRKLKAWLIDRKVPREERDRLLVLAAADGRILAVPSLAARASGLAPGFRVRLLPEG
jgi:tRNA(Ile)-lysidine synthase